MAMDESDQAVIEEVKANVVYLVRSCINNDGAAVERLLESISARDHQLLTYALAVVIAQLNEIDAEAMDYWLEIMLVNTFPSDE